MLGPNYNVFAYETPKEAPIAYGELLSMCVT